MTGSIGLRREGAAAWITIRNERRLNTLNAALMAEFVEAAESLRADDSLRAVVVTGEGDRAFIGGADINEMAALADGAAARAFITRVHRCCAVLRELPVPVIAAVDGYCFGAGLELAAACDVRVATEASTFGMPEVMVGIPSVVEAALLPGLIGWGRTRRLLLLGERIDAMEALAWGLVEKVVPGAAALDRAVAGWLHHLDEAGPAAVRRQKALIRRWEGLPLGEAIAAGVDAFAAAWDTDEPRRMLRAFVERPRKKG
ncbi:enoyl-CoA hydratase [Roseomonas sp. NAR14]|uniref:Enoyl-CoA hydratase n=1 Tax=Roseomonas acroporae TaxID=2937791 RepID=A0A9X1Y3S6_9PROT|nr:enoyl-CoA hydratase [Roseomonas acroporae]MCK8783634.1 enoyl-CoA hydratase [Roseomonas acroporae]